MDQRFWLALYSALPAVVLIVELATGKALNPLRGSRPFIVERSKQPGHYWGGIVLTVLFSAFYAWMGFEIFSNMGR